MDRRGFLIRTLLGLLLLGRLIGIVFLLPFLYFLARGYIPLRHWPKYALMFVLGGLQGDRDPGALPELPGPHPCGVDHVLALDVAHRRAHAGD